MTKEETLSCLKAYLNGDTAIGNIIPLRSVLESAIKFLEPSLPSNLDEAAEKWVENNCFDCDCVGENRAWDAFKAGAEWMAGQGVKASASVGYYNQCGLSILTEPSIKKLGFKEGDDLEITIRKK